MIRTAQLLVVFVALASCRTTDVAPGDAARRIQTVSLLGEPLLSPEYDAETRARLEAELAEARLALDEHPDDEDAAIWVGRRLAYLGRYREAVATFTEGLALHPTSHRLLRHRGHRWITLRDFDRAVADLSAAADLARDLPDAVEADGAPNAAGIPVSSTWSNIQYHLGLAHYLRGEYQRAHDAFAASMDTPLRNPDKVVSASHWMWQCLQRLDRPDDARALVESIPRDLDVIENHSYRDLIELYRGGPPQGEPDRLSFGDDPSAASYAYGYAGWLAAHDEWQPAEWLLRRIVRDTTWAAFGHIAAEVDLARTAAAAR